MNEAAEEANSQVYSQSLCKNSKQRRAEDVILYTDRGLEFDNNLFHLCPKKK